MHEVYQIDNVDREIMGILIENARTPYTEIAKKLLVSAGTIHVRMKKLEKMGVVLGTELVVDAAKLGFDMSAFIGVFLNASANYKEVVAQLKSIEEVVEAYYTTGGYSIFLKVTCKNTEHLRTVLNENIQLIRGIQRTETMISLEQPIRRKAPLGAVS